MPIATTLPWCAAGARCGRQARTEDVRLIGFDDSVYAHPDAADQHHSPLPERLAHEGCQALLAPLRGEEPEMETLVPVKPVQRASS
ncbi:MAG: hypothetical protein ACLTYW_06555 [Collinsella sp.]